MLESGIAGFLNVIYAGIYADQNYQVKNVYIFVKLLNSDYSLHANPLAQSPGQVKLDSDKLKL